MTASKLDRSPTRAWWWERRRRLRGWWSNKPPAHRILVRTSVVASVLLFTAAMVLDWYTTHHPGMSFPSLKGFVWNIAGGAVLATFVFTLVDDVRSWGTSWRRLKAMEDQLRHAVIEVERAAWEYLGLGPFTQPSGWEGVVEAADTVHRFCWSITARASAIHPYAPPGVTMGVSATVVDTWQRLEETVAAAPAGTAEWRRGRRYQWSLDRAVLRRAPAPEAVATATEALRVELVALRDLDMSVGTSGRASQALTHLDLLPVQAETLRSWMQNLAEADPPRFKPPEVPPAAPFVFFYLLALLSAAVAYEVETGLPHPDRI